MSTYQLNSREIVLLRDSILSHLDDISSLKCNSSYWDSYFEELNDLFIKLFPLSQSPLSDFQICFHATGAGYQD